MPYYNNNNNHVPSNSTFGIVSLFSIFKTLILLCLMMMTTTTSVASSIASTTTTTTTTSTTTTSLGQQAISAVMGESAVVDKETGRIYWEGGSSNTLMESITPKLLQSANRMMMMGSSDSNTGISQSLQHIKATILSVLLLFAVAGTLSQLIRDWLLSMTREIIMVDPMTSITTAISQHRHQRIVTTLFSITTHALLLLPKFPHWCILLIVILYVWESYTCSTHQYLLHIVDDAETYIEQLRSPEQVPIVEWKVRSFHYENYIYLPYQKLHQLLQWSSSILSTSNSSSVKVSQPPDTSSLLILPSFSSLFHWKRVTHSATGYYNYTSCIDQTIVGVWKRAPIIMMSHSPPSSSPTVSITNDDNNNNNDDDDATVNQNRSSTTNTTTTTTNATTTRKVSRVVVPMVKMVITKTVLLRDTKTRRDYFQQQKAFLRQEHHDDYAEFSTNVYLNHPSSLRTTTTTTSSSPRVLALRPSKSSISGTNSDNWWNSTLFHWPSFQRWLVHPYTYWFFTGIGMTVPYRRWLASQCNEVRVRVVKETNMEKPNISTTTNNNKNHGTKNPSWFSTSFTKS